MGEGGWGATHAPGSGQECEGQSRDTKSLPLALPHPWLSRASSLPQELATDILVQILVLPLADSTSSKPGYTLNPGFFIYSWGDNTHAFRFQD